MKRRKTVQRIPGGILQKAMALTLAILFVSMPVAASELPTADGNGLTVIYESGLEELLVSHYWVSGHNEGESNSIAFFSFNEDGTFSEVCSWQASGEWPNENYVINDPYLVIESSWGTYELTGTQLVIHWNTEDSKTGTRTYLFHDVWDLAPQEPQYNVSEYVSSQYDGEQYFYETNYPAEYTLTYSGETFTVTDPPCYLGLLAGKTANTANTADTWTCSNGHEGNTGNFCVQCGEARLQQPGTAQTEIVQQEAEQQEAALQQTTGWENYYREVLVPQYGLASLEQVSQEVSWSTADEYVAKMNWDKRSGILGGETGDFTGDGQEDLLLFYRGIISDNGSGASPDGNMYARLYSADAQGAVAASEPVLVGNCPDVNAVVINAGIMQVQGMTYLYVESNTNSYYTAWNEHRFAWYQINKNGIALTWEISYKAGADMGEALLYSYANGGESRLVLWATAYTRSTYPDGETVLLDEYASMQEIVAAGINQAGIPISLSGLQPEPDHSYMQIFQGADWMKECVRYICNRRDDDGSSYPLVMEVWYVTETDLR